MMRPFDSADRGGSQFEPKRRPASCRAAPFRASGLIHCRGNADKRLAELASARGLRTRQCPVWNESTGRESTPYFRPCPLQAGRKLLQGGLSSTPAGAVLLMAGSAWRQCRAAPRVLASNPIRYRLLWHKMRGGQSRTCCERRARLRSRALSSELSLLIGQQLRDFCQGCSYALQFSPDCYPCPGVAPLGHLIGVDVTSFVQGLNILYKRVLSFHPPPPHYRQSCACPA